MEISFEKWHGCKNDFLIIWASTSECQYLLASLQRCAPTLCSKEGDGVGADGIILCEVSLKSDHLPRQIHIINRDGSLAANCGNGLRCAALSLKKRLNQFRPTPDPLDGVELTVGNRTFWCDYLDNNGTNDENFVVVTMDEPQIDRSVNVYEQASQAIKRVSSTLNWPQMNDDWHICQLGNLHLIFFINEPLDSSRCYDASQALQQNGQGWDGINVHFVCSIELDKDISRQAKKILMGQISDAMQAYVFERGVGPTNACGSGAAAITACILDKGLSARSDWIAIAMPGGTLYGKQDEESGSVRLAGPAKFVFSGKIEI